MIKGTGWIQKNKNKKNGASYGIEATSTVYGVADNGTQAGRRTSCVPDPMGHL